MHGKSSPKPKGASARERLQLAGITNEMESPEIP
jgi:hypothetical protein